MCRTSAAAADARSPRADVAKPAGAAHHLSKSAPALQGKRVPVVDPPFTIKQLKDAIPPHCFERSTVTSLIYTSIDIAAVCLLLWSAQYIDHSIVPAPLRWILWPAYWILQGGVLTGLWVIAHECGHRAFSPSIFVCDVVGLILHTLLLVPYHPWRISHGKHHHFTSDMERDEVWIPHEQSHAPGSDSNESHPLFVLVETIVILLIGWPIYLFTHKGGRKYDNEWINHFNPNVQLFNREERFEVLISDAALVLCLAGLAALSYVYTFTWIAFVWGVPLLVVNFWLLFYTRLHHSDEVLPHYASKQWTWIKGALATIDRNYGIWSVFHHNIGDTHVLHHLFSKIPHYHAVEATEAIKPILGDYYRYDPTPWWKAGWHVHNRCRVVSEDRTQKGIYWFERKHAARD